MHHQWNKKIVSAFVPDYLVERQAARIFRQPPGIQTLRDLTPPVDQEFKQLWRQHKERQLQPRHYRALELFNVHFLTIRDCRHTLRTEYPYLYDQLDINRSKLPKPDQESPSKQSKRTRSPEQTPERLSAHHPSRLQPPGPTVEDLLTQDAADRDDTPFNPQANTPEAAPPARRPVLSHEQTTFSVEFTAPTEDLHDQAIDHLTQATQQLADHHPDLPKPTIRLNSSNVYRCA